LRPTDKVSKTMERTLIVEDTKLTKELNKHVYDHHDPYNRGRNHQNVRLYHFDMWLGNDTMDGQEGNDLMIGDYGWIAQPSLKLTTNRTQAKAVEREFNQLDQDMTFIEGKIAAQNAARRWDHKLFVGNDILNGGAGDDMLLGDYARIIKPSVTGTGPVKFAITFGTTGHHTFINSRGQELRFANDTLDGGTGSNLLDVQRGSKNQVKGNYRAARASDFLARMQKMFAGPVNPWLERFVVQDVTAAGSGLSMESLLVLGIAG
jgi:hypothetical protein